MMWWNYQLQCIKLRITASTGCFYNQTKPFCWKCEKKTSYFLINEHTILMSMWINSKASRYNSPRVWDHDFCQSDNQSRFNKWKPIWFTVMPMHFTQALCLHNFICQLNLSTMHKINKTNKTIWNICRKLRKWDGKINSNSSWTFVD